MSEYTPFHLILTGNLQDILVTGLALETELASNQPALVQLIRYNCGSEAWARLVRIIVETPGQPAWKITPAGASDSLQIRRHVSEAGRLKVRLIRGDNVDVGALPDLSAYDVRLEVFG